MRILYGIQGTGHGHISRAREILPLLSGVADIDVLISGYNCKLGLDQDLFVIHKRGISLAYDSRGSVSWLQTALQIQPGKFVQDIRSLDASQYDLVISDYEPITAWACYASDTPVVGLSHQASFLSPLSPRPRRQSPLAEQIMKHFAPCTIPIGFHFRRYDSFILPPVIRTEIRKLNPVKKSHCTVYLPAFDPETLASVFFQCQETDWHLFSPFCDVPSQKRNVWMRPVGNRAFLESMESCTGVVTGAGFETCAEAMYLDKKLLAIPIRNQYEQLCNAAALKKMGVPVIDQIDSCFPDKIAEWVKTGKHIPLDEAADTQALIQKLKGFAEEPENAYSRPGRYRSEIIFR